jgi:hypothetical protein
LTFSDLLGCRLEIFPVAGVFAERHHGSQMERERFTVEDQIPLDLAARYRATDSVGRGHA